MTRGRRPDGLSLGPWYSGMGLVWYATAIVMDTFAHSVTAKTAPERQALQQQRLRLQNTENTTMTSLTIHFNQSQPKQLPGVYGETTAPFLSGFTRQRNMLVCLVAPGRDNVSISACPWLYSKGECCQLTNLCAGLILFWLSLLRTEGAL